MRRHFGPYRTGGHWQTGECHWWRGSTAGGHSHQTQHREAIMDFVTLAIVLTIALAALAFASGDMPKFWK